MLVLIVREELEKMMKADVPEQKLINKQDVLDSINERLHEVRDEMAGLVNADKCFPDALVIEYNTLIENGRNLIDEMNKELLNEKENKKPASFKQKVLELIVQRMYKGSTVGDPILKERNNILWALQTEISSWKD